jgi:hypothetical protein
VCCLGWGASAVCLWRSWLVEASGSGSHVCGGVGWLLRRGSAWASHAAQGTRVLCSVSHAQRMLLQTVRAALHSTALHVRPLTRRDSIKLLCARVC